MTVPADRDRAATKGASSAVTAPAGRPACCECQRRKQKCDRQWPCSNCLKRKIGDTCNFRPEVESNSAWIESLELKRKRDGDDEADDDEWDPVADLESIGYTTAHMLSNLDIRPGSKEPDQYRVDFADKDLQRALEALPPRHIVDTLVQNFVENVNYYYYIVYPPHFVRDYATWWRDHERKERMGIPWTCLLIMVCACSIQHTDAAVGAQLEAQLGAPVKELTDRYHNAARALHAAIPVGQNHVYTVQYLLHSCYWFKAEARFVECWSILGATVREAQALGLHLEPKSYVTEFKREMRSRLWCIVDSWDWLVSSLLARPMLIDRSDSTVSLPNLALEGFPVSPLLHLKLQSELVGIIFKRFGPPKVLTDPTEIREYREILEAFMGTFPPAYAFENPDTSHEQMQPWIALHRHYMHTCTLSITLGAFRPYMAKNMTRETPKTELDFRGHGVSYALRLMKAVQRFFEYVWSRDSTFHFVPFCIFDTAALLCSALLHDKDGSIPQRDEIVSAINLALSTLKKLRSATDTAKAPYDVLRRLVKKVWGPLAGVPDDGYNKRHRGNDASPTPPPLAPKPVSVQPVPLLAADPRIVAKPLIPVPIAAAHNEPPMLFPSPPGSAGPYGSSSTNSSPPAAQFVLNSGGPHEANPWPQGYQQQPVGHAPIVSAAPMNPINGAIGWSEQEIPQLFDANMQPVPPMGSMASMSSIPAMSMPSGPPMPPAPPGPQMQQDMFTNSQLGDLATLWNWQSLDLGFSNNPIMYQQ